MAGQTQGKALGSNSLEPKELLWERSPHCLSKMCDLLTHYYTFTTGLVPYLSLRPETSWFLTDNRASVLGLIHFKGHTAMMFRTKLRPMELSVKAGDATCRTLWAGLTHATNSPPDPTDWEWGPCAHTACDVCAEHHGASAWKRPPCHQTQPSHVPWEKYISEAKCSVSQLRWHWTCGVRTKAHACLPRSELSPWGSPLSIRQPHLLAESGRGCSATALSPTFSPWEPW